MLHCMPLRPMRGGFARRTVRRIKEHAYRYAVLVGMLHCIPLCPMATGVARAGRSRNWRSPLRA